jgi:isoquinoline 1-oxidoreductase alpha subunit
MKLEINGKSYDVDDTPERLLLWVVRDELGLIGTKFGCGAGICGSCTLHVDGVATRACITPVSQTAGKKITTIEGLANGDKLHPVQQAWLDMQVPQCSWCQSGQMMSAAAFLNQTPNPTEQQVVDAMNNNYCRCGCYTRIKAAVLKAAGQ